MSLNNATGSIPKNFLMLKRLEKALMGEYLKMSDDEILELNKEIEEATTNNCSDTQYDIAKNSYRGAFIET